MKHDTLHWVTYNLMKQKDASIQDKVNQLKCCVLRNASEIVLYCTY